MELIEKNNDKVIINLIEYNRLRDNDLILKKLPIYAVSITTWQRDRLWVYENENLPQELQDYISEKYENLKSEVIEINTRIGKYTKIVDSLPWIIKKIYKLI